MFETTNGWLEIAQKNKTLVILWSAFLACLTFAFNESASLADKRVALRDAAAAMEGLKAEHNNFQQMVHVWEKCFQGLDDQSAETVAKLTPDQLAPITLSEQISRSLRAQLQTISEAIGNINNLYFSLPSNQDLRTKLLATNAHILRFRFTPLFMNDDRKELLMSVANMVIQAIELHSEAPTDGFVA